MLDAFGVSLKKKAGKSSQKDFDMAFSTRRRKIYQKLSTEDENSDITEDRKQSIDNNAFNFGSQELAARTMEENQTREQFLQSCGDHRRQAVCEKIEREMFDERGISLRKLRKYMILELILREVNLL